MHMQSELHNVKVVGHTSRLCFTFIRSTRDCMHSTRHIKTLFIPKLDVNKQINNSDADFLNSLTPDQLFEGMKAYRCVDGRIRMFRPDMNMARMNASAKRSGLPTFEAREFIKCLKRLITIDQGESAHLAVTRMHKSTSLHLFSEWVPHTEAASLYIRPTLIGIEPTLGVASSDSALLYTILSPVGGYFKPGASAAGISLLADPQYVRAWPGGVGDRKVGSNYGPTIQIQKEATAQGVNQVLWLYGQDQQVTEAGTMNMFMLMVNEQGGECRTNFGSSLFLFHNLNLMLIKCQLSRTRTRHAATQRSDSARHHARLDSTSCTRVATVQSVGANIHDGRRATAAV